MSASVDYTLRELSQEKGDQENGNGNGNGNGNNYDPTEWSFLDDLEAEPDDSEGSEWENAAKKQQKDGKKKKIHT